MTMIMLLLWLDFSWNIVFNKIVFSAIFDRNYLSLKEIFHFLLKAWKFYKILTVLKLIYNHNLLCFHLFLCWNIKHKLSLGLQFNCVHKWKIVFLNLYVQSTQLHLRDKRA